MSTKRAFLLFLVVLTATGGRVGWIHARVMFACAQARVAAESADYPVRLSSASGWAADLARKFPIARTSEARLDLAAELLDRMGDAGARDRLRIAGTAYFIAGRYAGAAESFARVNVAGRTSRDWNDLAAACIALARQTHAYRDWLDALNAVNRAAAMDPESIEVRFNHATLLDDLGMDTSAERAWRVYILADPVSEWSALADQRRLSIPPNDRQAWSALDLDTASEPSLAAMARRYPQQARTYAEGPLLASWAEAFERGDRVSASRLLARGRIIGDAIAHRSGEIFLRDAIARAGDPTSSEMIARGHLIYRQGRLSYSNQDHVAAEQELAEAARWLARGGSPMALAAEIYAASAVFNQHDPERALPQFRRLLERLQRSRSASPAYVARVLHEIALCEAVLGHWSSSLAAAEEATSLFRRLGERANAAAAEAIVAEDFDLIGKPDLAWRHGLSARRDACAAGDHRRARVILAALCRTEMRGRRWEPAASVVTLEKKLAALTVDAWADTDMLVRSAAIEAQRNGYEASGAALERARSAARRLPAGPPRDLWLSDVDAVAGFVASRHEPRRAMALLTSAIDFQQRAQRPIMLPELYLHRGRVQIALNEFAAAERDFDNGIRELEQQRSTVRAELRAGIFDDASELFDDAIELQVRMRRDPQRALAYVERGRARAMLEQMGVATTASPIADVQRLLGADTLIVEYAVLSQSLVIFIVSRDRVHSTLVPITRSQLTQRVNTLFVAIAQPGDAAPILNAAAELYDVLVRPVATQLHGVAHVNFIGADVLQRVPFALLYDRSARAYLIQRFTVATPPSAGVFLAMARRAVSKHPPASAVVFANPAAPARFRTLAALGNSEKEAEQAVRRYARGQRFLRHDATAERFLQTAKNFEVVHFAGHALANEAEPGESALIFADSPAVPGTLILRQIAGLSFTRTRVVVLAACGTMTGRNGAVEGMSSLARAFVIAGVPSVVATLWDIEDGEAVTVTRNLHREIARGVAPELALRSAQLAAIRSPRTADRDPRHWGAFAVAGALASRR